MKKIVALIFLVVSLHAGVNRALVIGVNGGSLVYALNDARAMAYLLKNRGVTDIHKLYDSQATKSNIMRHLKSMVKHSHQGDRVYLFFSGHGTSYYDPAIQNNPRLKKMLKNSGGLIPWGVTPRTYERGMISSKYDLAPLFRELDRKKVETVVIFDACFTGSAFKDFALHQSTKALPISATPYYSSHGYPYKHIVYLSATTQSDFASESHRDRRGYFSMAITSCMAKHNSIKRIKGCMAKAKTPQTAIILASNNLNIFPPNQKYKELVYNPPSNPLKERVFNLANNHKSFQLYTQNQRGLLQQNYNPSTPLDLYLHSKKSGYLLFLMLEASGTLEMVYPNSRLISIQANTNKKILTLTPTEPFGEEILGAYLVDERSAKALQKIYKRLFKGVLSSREDIDSVVRIIRNGMIEGARISLISRLE
jgi:hypothetical protein